jgi:LPXTG-site transpeptidase (sortase) family protein
MPKLIPLIKLLRRKGQLILRRVSELPAIFWLLLAALSALVCIGWATLTFGPILVLEARYQTLQLMSTVFGVSDIRQILIPDFRALDHQGRTRHELGYAVVIPKLYLDEPVIFNTDPQDKAEYTEALKKGIAHAAGTALPGDGGLGYYFAHSASLNLINQYNAVFYLLGKLESGDDIYIWREGTQYRYQVTYKRITSPDDVSFLDVNYGSETIVLQTCWPPGTTSQRLLVFAELVEIL